jgi:Adaptin N terminal region
VSLSLVWTLVVSTDPIAPQKQSKMSGIAPTGSSIAEGAAAAVATAASSAADPTALLNSQLASALSTLGDAQYWEETISPSTIRNELSAADPSNPNSTPVLLKGMKWLLASISKGRDVSDFYPHVVKLVGATSLEVRKMVYMYLVQYADHDGTTRELSLLSINSFQRGLADSEQLIRALALRVLSSIRIPDILQIQILGVQKCASDSSPYVRKCAANALSKLAPRCDPMQREMLLKLLKENLLDKESCTMVLTSSLVSFQELCPDRLELLHASFRKICHLLTDMDEWGQVIVIDLLSRYCRRFFREPRGWKEGTAELIDQERRVQRRLGPNGKVTTTSGTYISSGPVVIENKGIMDASASTTNQQQPQMNGKYSDNNPQNQSKSSTTPQKIKRRVATKGFYSDEEDGSTEEEVYVMPGSDPSAAPSVSLASAMRQRNILGLPTINRAAIAGDDGGDGSHDDGDGDLKFLDKDHQLLILSTMPLLKSRNAGVVLAVCSLLYYCGVSSIKARSSMGKALVRIHRGRREIQYVVLTSIRVLVQDCPSAFAPFLPDFFVKALDPSFTRLIKIDILVSLALEPAAIEAVLNELRTYIRHGDRVFASASVRAVGRVVELARIVYDRHGSNHGNPMHERQTANRIALDALYGLSMVTQASDSKMVIGEAVSVMHNIIVLLGSSPEVNGVTVVVDDPNQVQAFAMRRVAILLLNALCSRLQETKEEDDNDDEDNGDEEGSSDLALLTIDLPPPAVSSAIWIVGDWLAKSPPSPSASSWIHGTMTNGKVRLELLRLVDQCFPDMVASEKEQAIHFASKTLMASAAAQSLSTDMSVSTPTPEAAICEHILSMGRIDTNPDLKDRARFESAILHTSIGLKYDTDAMDEKPGMSVLSIQKAKTILLAKSPSPSYLPTEDDMTVDMHSFRFGTLSSLVGHRARGAYLPLPPWADKDSPSILRDEVDAAKEQLAPNFKDPSQAQIVGGDSGFYGDNSDSSSSSSDSSSSSSSDSSEGSDADSESDSDSDDDSSSDVQKPNLMMASQAQPNAGTQSNALFSMMSQPSTQSVPPFQSHLSSQNSSDDEFSSSDDSSSSSSSTSSDNEYNGDISSANMLTSPIASSTNKSSTEDGNLLNMMGASGFAPVPEVNNAATSSALNDFKGLVMTPPAAADTNSNGPDMERDSSAWVQIVRPELCSGLSVNARFLRGPTRDRELQLKNMHPSNPCLVCIQMQLGNM